MMRKRINLLTGRGMKEERDIVLVHTGYYWVLDTPVLRNKCHACHYSVGITPVIHLFLPTFPLLPSTTLLILYLLLLLSPCMSHKCVVSSVYCVVCIVYCVLCSV